MVPSTLDNHILNLDYRKGTDLPELKYGFPDSHFICFPYETQRTGIFATGCVRAPMDLENSKIDGTGAAFKAIQAATLVARGQALTLLIRNFSCSAVRIVSAARKNVLLELSMKQKKAPLSPTQIGVADAAFVWAVVPKELFLSKISVLKFYPL
jgi:heterodisulfide reductase subunit A-like polyferredoxin